MSENKFKLYIDGVEDGEYDCLKEACMNMLFEMDKSVLEWEKNVRIDNADGRVVVRADWVAYDNWTVNFLP